MATDDFTGGADARAAGWLDRLSGSAGPSGGGVPQPGAAARDEGARGIRKPRGLAARVADGVEPPSAPHAAALAAPGAIASTLDLLGLPALVVDSIGRVLDANRTARPMLCGRLLVVNGCLAAVSHSVTMALRNLVTQAAAGRPVQPVAVPQGSRHPLMVYAFPLPGGLPEPAGCVLAIVLDLESRTGPPASHVRHAFGLTEAQSRVAALLAAGVDLDTAAAALGISRETVRGHLRAVHAKTGVRRRSELVALIGRLLPAAGGAPPRDLQPP